MDIPIPSLRTAKRPRTEAKPLEIPPNVTSLSIHALRVELHRRRLPTLGLRPDLEARLVRSLQLTERPHTRGGQSRSISVPNLFPPTTAPFANLHPPPNKLVAERPPHKTEQYEVIGVLKNRAVWICGDRQMHAFWSRGMCGKANLSRSAPSYNVRPEDMDVTLKGRAMRQMLAMEADTSAMAGRADVEHLQLTLVEAFYAAFVEKNLCLQDEDGTRLEDAHKVWHQFCLRCPEFAMKFVAYSRYRAAGWLPRSGLKYGVDWVLYPASSKKHTHSPYCIVLRFGHMPGQSQVSRSWIGLQNHLRLVKNVAKTLVLADVYVKNGADCSSSVKCAFESVAINEVTIDRWVT